MTATTVQFSTTQYVFAHGREPRGTGSWAFRPWGSREPWTFFEGSYSEARRQATRWARERGVGRVEVGS